MNETQVTIIGNVGDRPTLGVTSKGHAMARFGVASTERRPDPDGPGYVDGETSWYQVTAFRGLASNVAASLDKGHPVIVRGRQRVRTYTKGDGTRAVSVDVEALEIGHNLRLGTASFQRAGGGHGPTGERRWGAAEGDPFAGTELAASGPLVAVAVAVADPDPATDGPGPDGDAATRPFGGFGDPETDPYVVDGMTGEVTPAVPEGEADSDLDRDRPLGALA